MENSFEVSDEVQFSEVFRFSLYIARKEPVTGSVFTKSSGLTENHSESICGGVCFKLQAVMGLFIDKLQVITINGSEGF